MPDASVNIGGDASGALAAIGEVKAAIAGLTGKTIVVNVETRGGGGAAVAGLASDLGRAGGAADKVGRSARGMGENFERAGRSAGGMGDNLKRAGEHVGRAADDAERFATHMNAVDNIMRGGAPGAVQHAAGMRQMAVEAGRAQQAIGGIGSSAQQAQRAIEAGGNGGFKAMGANAHAVTVEVMGIYRNTRQAITAAGEAGNAFSTASGHTSQMGTDLARTGARAGEAGKELARLGESGKELARVGDAAKNLGGSGNGLSGMDLAAKGLRDSLGGLSRGFADEASELGPLAGVAGAAAGPLKMIGLASGISAIGMGALGAAVAGVGLAGVAEDFAHNNQLMNAGKDAVRGFNKEFSAMRSQTTAAGLPQMDALGASIKGVGHELAQIGADNMAPTLQHASALAGSLTQTMKQLAPAIGPSEQALTSLAGAALGAFGNSAPEIARFANIVTQNAGGLQSATESIVRGASALGGGLVQGVSAAAPFLHGAANAAAWGTDLISGAAGIPSDFSDQPNADGSMPNSVDTGVPDGQGGTVKRPGSSLLSRIGSGAFKGASIGAFIGGFAGPEGIPIGGAVGGVVGGVAGAFDAPGFVPPDVGGETPTLGAPQSLKQMGLGSKPSKFGSFGPGSGGPAVPAGPSGSQIMEQQRADIGLPPTGQPQWDGLGGSRSGGMGSGPGSAFHAAPAAPVGGMAAPMAALGSLMTGGMQAQVAGGGAQTGQAMVQHIQKAVQAAAPAAAAGGAAVGSGIGGGMAAGTSSSMTVTDTVVVKHVKHIIEVAAAALGIHSPSKEFDYLARMSWAGFGQGSERASADTFGQVSNHMGGVLSAAQSGAHKFGYDYQNGGAPPAVTVSRKDPIYQAPTDADTDPQQARADWQKSLGNQQGQYNPGSDAWWGAHNNRAEQLQAKRQANHERALSQIGAVNKSTGQPYKNPFQADSNPFGPSAENPAGSRQDPQATGSRIGHATARRDSQQGWRDQKPGQPGQAGVAGSGPGSALHVSGSKLTGPWAGLNADLHTGMVKAGQNSAQGAANGLMIGIPKIAAAGAMAAGAGQMGFKKKDKQSSPSAVWAEMGGNSVAGAVGGMNAGGPALAAAGAGVASTLQAATAGPMADSGLAVGYTWATNVGTGISTQIKKSDFQSLGLPSGIGQAGMLGLAGTGLLSAGSGASGYKTPGNAPGVVTLPAASSGGNQTITVNHNFDLGGQVVQAVTQITLDMFGRVTDAVPLMPTA